MSGSEVNPKVILREYADALMADVQATTQEERDEAGDGLIEASRRMEEHGRQVASLIYELLTKGSTSVPQSPAHQGNQ